MTSALQNRLVGTIIVVALVVIVLPEFLDGEKRTNKQEFVEVPPVADALEVLSPNTLDFSSIERDTEQPVEVVDEPALDDDPASTDDVSDVQQANSGDQVEQNTAQNAAQDTKKSNESRVQAKVTAAPDPLDLIDTKDSGWVVQLGSFRHEKNVKALLKTLQNAGYRAYSSPVMTSVGRLNKVFVGPELDRQRLEQALPHLQEITQLKGKITAYEVSAK